MSEYFPELKSSGGKVKGELDLFNHATKADFKNATSVNTSKIAKKADLASLKSNVDKLDIDKLKNVPIGLRDLPHSTYAQRRRGRVKPNAYDCVHGGGVVSRLRTYAEITHFGPQNLKTFFLYKRSYYIAIYYYV